jgi:Predicted Fe-S oxidoreductases
MKEASLDHLSRIIQLKRVPFSIVFEITDRCNLTCLHCYQENGGKEALSFHEIKLILDDLEKLGTMKVTLTGGEPLLREDFIEIFFYCSQKGFATKLFTNATLLNSEHKKAFLKKPPFAVECSLYGASAKTHELITGVAGSFEKTLANITWMVEKRIRVLVKSVMLCLNVHEMEALDRLCHGLGVTLHPTFRVYPSCDPSRSPERWRVKTEDLKALRKKKGALFKNHSDSDNKSGELVCNAGREACCINAEGKVYPCVALRWECGEVRKQSLPEIWVHSSVLQKIRSFHDQDFKSAFHANGKNPAIFVQA